MKTKTYEIKTTGCNSVSAKECEACSDAIIEKLKPLGLKLIADNPEDAVNGSISIVHDTEHLVRIEIYTETEKPNTEHKSTLKKPKDIPTEKQCLDCLK